MEPMNVSSELATRCLGAFPGWLRSLPHDVQALSAVVEAGDLSGAAARVLVGALNYVMKTSDLIQEGVEGLALVDEAFVLRAAAAQAASVDDGLHDERILGLAEDLDLIHDFLERDVARFSALVSQLAEGTVRGRNADIILGADELRAELLGELRAWATALEIPAFFDEPNDLVKLRAFFSTKLPDLSAQPIPLAPEVLAASEHS